MKSRGIVKFWKDDKGFGFVKQANGADVFCHVSQLPDGIDSLNPGQKVACEIEETPKGIRAINVEIE